LIDGFGELFSSEGKLTIEMSYDRPSTSKPRIERLKDEPQDLPTAPRR
jgi:hypothetical protein